MKSAQITVTLPSGHDPLKLDSGNQFSIQNGKYCIVVPMHDWWTHTEDYDLHAAGVIVGTLDGNPLLEFPDEEGRISFRDWLKKTLVKQRYGFDTMYP